MGIPKTHDLGFCFLLPLEVCSNCLRELLMWETPKTALAPLTLWLLGLTSAPQTSQRGLGGLPHERLAQSLRVPQRVYFAQH
jgi:hypothetical protein